MKKILFLFTLFLLFSFSYAQPIFDFTWTVTKIIDGDTVYASTWWTAFKVRILWMDTPEKYLFWWIKDYKYYWCWVSASHFAVEKLVKWKKYWFYKDSLAKSVGKYWRKLRFINLWNENSLTYTWTYWYSILKQWLANFYKYENQTFSWIYKQIDDENKIAWKWMYNPFCKAQDKYVKKNWHRSWSWEIQNIIDKTLLSKKNFHYQLQNAKFNQLKNLSWTIIFVDPEDSKLTWWQLWQLKQNGNIIIAYLSIWEAENYRAYWNNNWKTNSPSWLGEENPSWTWSYYVKYRLTWWQNIVFNEIDKIKNIWYDWVVLDTLDTYSYRMWNGTWNDYDQKMVDFVWKIRKHLWDYLAIIPNGWLQLVENTWYLDLINWQLTEDLFSYKNKERTDTDKKWQLQYLNKVKQAWKQVFDIDYISWDNNLVCKYYDFIKEKEFLGADYKLWLDSFDKIKCKKKLNFTIPSWKWLWVWKTSFSNVLNWKMSRKYLYDSGTQQDNLVNFVKTNNIKKVYLFIWSLQWNWDSLYSKHKLYNEQWLSKLLTRLNQLWVSTYALYYINDDPNNLDNYEKVSDIVQSVADYNTRYPNAKFVWLQLDQEVYKQEVYDKFLSMLKLIEKNTNKYNLINQVALKPLWARQDYNWEKFVKKISDIIDEWVIMAYDDELKTIENIANKAFYWKLDIWIDLWKNTTNSWETLYDEIKKNGLNWFDNQILDKLNNDYSWNNLFEWVSIHHYVSYFYLEKWVEPINYKIIFTCIDLNWKCSASCNWIWQKVGNCTWWVQKSGSCSSSCNSWWWGWWLNYFQISQNYKKIKQKKRKKQKLVNKNLEENLKKSEEKKLKKVKVVVKKVKKTLINYLEKRWMKEQILILKIEKLVKKIQNYKLWKISRKQLKLAINKFVKIYKKEKERINKLEKTKKQIQIINFKINTNHKYLKYENIFKNFFQKSKTKVLNNSKYWTEDYHNYLKSFVIYTNWLFTDLENKNYENIKSYVGFFKKIVKKLKDI